MAIAAQDLANLTDDELAAEAQAGNDAATEVLLRRYQGFVRAKARGYFLVGSDANDVHQEGMIGLFKAIRDYRTDRAASFHSFAELCITRQIITAIKAATRQKHQALNGYVSFSAPVGDDANDRTSEEVLVGGDESLDPELQFIASEAFGTLQGTLGEILSPFEQDVLIRYVEGVSYVEIGEALGRHAKSIDNAIQRIKRKLESHLERAANREAVLARAC